MILKQYVIDQTSKCKPNNNKFIGMASIAQLYSMKNSASTGGIEGYHLPKKYIDSAKMKQQRLMSQSKQHAVASKIVNISKKTTFIDEVQKKAAKLPGPSTYEPIIRQKSKTSEIVKHPDRKTFIDEVAQQEKKKHVPGAGTYDKIQMQVDKTKLRPNLSKAESPTYLQACMRNSIDCPGVGNYNAYYVQYSKMGSKWVADPEKSRQKKISNQKLPPVGTYNPNPVHYRLFSSISGSEKEKRKISIGMGGKSSRFSASSKDKKLPFYDVLSEWGMKGKLKRKDILAKISSHPNTHRSVYY